MKVPAKHESMIRMALYHWIERCKKEAETMRTWAIEYESRPDMSAKCRANADASESFIADSRAALDWLETVS